MDRFVSGSGDRDGDWDRLAGAARRAAGSAGGRRDWRGLCDLRGAVATMCWFGPVPAFLYSPRSTPCSWVDVGTFGPGLSHQVVCPGV